MPAEVFDVPAYGEAVKAIEDNWSAGQPPIMLGGALEPTLMLSKVKGIEPRYMLGEFIGAIWPGHAASLGAHTPAEKKKNKR